MSPEWVHALAELHQRALGSTVEGWDETSLLALLSNKNVVMTTIGSGGSLNSDEDTEPVAGFALSLKTESEADLLTIVIAPEYQGCGLGKALIEMQSQTLKDQGVRTWYLEVHEHNEPAVAFYENVGFRTCARRPNYYPAWEGKRSPRAAALVMCCNLD